MTDDASNLIPATIDELAHALAFALQFAGRRRFRKGDELMAKITAEHLVDHLQRSGFVIMQKPPGPMHSTPMDRQRD